MRLIQRPDEDRIRLRFRLADNELCFDPTTPQLKRCFKAADTIGEFARVDFDVPTEAFRGKGYGDGLLSKTDSLYEIRKDTDRSLLQPVDDILATTAKAGYAREV